MSVHMLRYIFVAREPTKQLFTGFSVDLKTFSNKKSINFIGKNLLLYAKMCENYQNSIYLAFDKDIFIVYFFIFA